MKILVTGTAGFIGMHTAAKLLERGDTVIGIDNLNDYYDVTLKQARLEQLTKNRAYTHVHADLSDRSAIETIFKIHRPERVIHLAAQAGVRYAATNPHAYVESNVTGFLHVLEGCRHYDVEHLVFASTSSVYGANTGMPFSEHQPTEHPITLYAATKKANEVMAHSYAHLYRLPCTGLRFFTVYGPWGRPDMALFIFTRNILEGRPITVFNKGNHSRSFTFIDDIVEGVTRASDHIASPNPKWNGNSPDSATSHAPYRIFNVGSKQNTTLLKYIELLEEALGQKAEMRMLPLQAGDVPDTIADTSDLEEVLGFKPRVPVAEGIARFVKWYRSYYQI